MTQATFDGFGVAGADIPLPRGSETFFLRADNPLLDASATGNAAPMRSDTGSGGYVLLSQWRSRQPWPPGAKPVAPSSERNAQTTDSGSDRREWPGPGLGAAPAATDSSAASP